METTDSQGRHKVGGDVVVRGGDNIAEIEATVQRYNGGWYNTSHKWSASGNGGAGVLEYIYLNTGTYRMRLVVKVYSPPEHFWKRLLCTRMKLLFNGTFLLYRTRSVFED